MGQSVTTLSHVSSPRPDSRMYFSDRNRKNSPYKVVKTTGKVGRPLDKFFTAYELLPDRLGQGTFSEVRLAQDKEDMCLVAVKVLMKSQLEVEDIEDHRRECEILKTLQHQNVVKVYEYYEDEKFIFTVMEYASAGELVSKLEQLEDFSERETRDIMLTLVDALSYCKQMGIAHRDIKPSNILLREVFRPDSVAPGRVTRFREAKVRYEIVLADFGFAKQVSQENLYTSFNALKTQCGSPLFIAPEILREEPYNYKCDIWSLGVLCFMMLSGGERPFGGDDRDELFRQIMDGVWDFEPAHVWDKVSKQGKDFVSLCLIADNEHRANYKELLRCEWFQKEDASKRTRIDMKALQEYNSNRQFMSKVKRQKAGASFRGLMEELDEEHRKEGGKEDSNFGKYLKVYNISAFYENPNIETAAEKTHKKKRRRRKKQALQLRPPRNFNEIHPRDQLHTVYFKDVDNIL